MLKLFDERGSLLPRFLILSSNMGEPNPEYDKTRLETNLIHSNFCVLISEIINESFKPSSQKLCACHFKF